MHHRLFLYVFFSFFSFLFSSQTSLELEADSPESDSRKFSFFFLGFTSELSKITFVFLILEDFLITRVFWLSSELKLDSEDPDRGTQDEEDSDERPDFDRQDRQSTFNRGRGLFIGSYFNFKLLLMQPKQSAQILQMKTTSNGRQPQSIKYLSNHLWDSTQILNLSLHDQTRMYKTFIWRRPQWKMTS